MSDGISEAVNPGKRVVKIKPIRISLEAYVTLNARLATEATDENVRAAHIEALTELCFELAKKAGVTEIT